MKKIILLLLLSSCATRNTVPCQVETKVINAGEIEIGDDLIKLEGISAPIISQICDDKNGEEYGCGQKAWLYLVGLIERDNISCDITEKLSSREYNAICRTAKYILNEEMIKAGWAIVLDSKNLQHAKFEKQARKEKKGVWQGKFDVFWQYKKAEEKKDRKKFVGF